MGEREEPEALARRAGRDGGMGNFHCWTGQTPPRPHFFDHDVKMPDHRCGVKD
jgi:hypothetical protein